MAWERETERDIQTIMCYWERALGETERNMALTRTGFLKYP